MEQTFTKFPAERPDGPVREFVIKDMVYDGQFFEHAAMVEARRLEAEFELVKKAHEERVRRQLELVLPLCHVRPGDVVQLPPHAFWYRVDSLTLSSFGCAEVYMTRLSKENPPEEIRMKGAFGPVREVRRLINMHPDWIIRKAGDDGPIVGYVRTRVKAN